MDKNHDRILDASVMLFSIEKFLDIKLPKSYFQFIIENNGFIPEGRLSFNFLNSTDGSILDEIFGFHKKSQGILDWLKNYANRIPRKTIPVGCDTFGNLILISISGDDYGKIYYWDHEREANDGEEPDYSNLTLVADSFDEFIAHLKSEDDLDD